MLLKAYAFLVLTTLCWAANAIAGKLAVGHVSPFLLTSARWGIAFVIALAFGRKHLADDRAAILRTWPLLGLYGAIGFACFNATFYSAAKYTSAINIVIIQAGMPLIIFLINFFVFRVRVGLGQTLGFVATLAGVLIVTSNGSLETLAALHFNRGDALMLLAVLFYGSYTAFLRFKPKIHWLSFMAVAAGAAFLTSLPFSAWEVASGEAIAPDLRGAALCLFTALLPGFVAQAAFVRGNELIGSNRAGLFINLVPVFGTLMSVGVLGEAIHAYHAVALILVIGGIALSERSRRPA